MKKIYLLALILIMGIAYVSCDKSDATEFDVTVKSSLSEDPSGPATPAGVAPYIIPGANNGGNRTCAEVGTFFKDDPAYFDWCGDRVDYGMFSGAFPDGLDVTSDGKTLSFNADECIKIGDKYYKVGAVIVKGGPAANVYFYEEGTLSDVNLTAPANASGKPAGISNVTFCYIECEEQPELVIAFKSYLNNSDWVCTTGGPGNIGFVAYYEFKPGVVGKVYLSAGTTPSTGDLTKPVGNLTVADTDGDGQWEVTVDNVDRPDLLYKKAYLFVGTLAEYTGKYYLNFPYQTGEITPVAPLIFQLPF
ncbi:MAG TPA: hypothetical protein PKG68_08585 [Bacteroidales bacterium]|jgi:hypothetical protein|nr:hypothetical protein [Bacteroidales bacterium]